jgi:hypothetical protein
LNKWHVVDDRLFALSRLDWQHDDRDAAISRRDTKAVVAIVRHHIGI